MLVVVRGLLVKANDNTTARHYHNRGPSSSTSFPENDNCPAKVLYGISKVDIIMTGIKLSNFNGDGLIWFYGV